MKATRNIRAKRRGAALAALGQLAPLVHRRRVNDRIGSHISIWLTADARVEWWPGSQRWRCHEGNTHFGDADELIAFVERARRAQQVAGPPSPSIIDPADTVILRRLVGAAA